MHKLIIFGSFAASLLLIALATELGELAAKAIPLKPQPKWITTSTGRNDEDKVAFKTIEKAHVISIQSVEGVLVAEVRLEDNYHHFVFPQKEVKAGDAVKVTWITLLETTGSKPVGFIR